MKLVIRKTIVPDGLWWFHDYYRFNDGTFQIAFFCWLIYTRK